MQPKNCIESYSALVKAMIDLLRTLKKIGIGVFKEEKNKKSPHFCGDLNFV